MKRKELYSFGSQMETDKTCFNPDEKVITIMPPDGGTISLHGRSEVTYFVCGLLEYSENVFIGDPMYAD